MLPRPIYSGACEREFVEKMIMKSATETAVQETKVIHEDSSRLPAESIGRGYLLDRILYFVQIAVGYGFGIHVGLAVGWLFGRYVGGIYVEHCEPVHLSDLNEIMHWYMMPWTFARAGAIVGVLAGLLAIRIAETIFLNRAVTSLYENDVVEAADIARILGASVRQIQRRMNRLARREVITYQTVDSSEKTSFYVPDEKDPSCHLVAPTPALERASR